MAGLVLYLFDPLMALEPLSHVKARWRCEPIVAYPNLPHFSNDARRSPRQEMLDYIQTLDPGAFESACRSGGGDISLAVIRLALSNYAYLVELRDEGLRL